MMFPLAGPFSSFLGFGQQGRISDYIKFLLYAGLWVNQSLVLAGNIRNIIDILIC